MTPRTVVRQQTTRRFRGGAPTDLWDWSMWIEPAPGRMLDSIRRVVYSLHPAFPNPNRVILQVAGGFRLDVHSDSPLGETWGTFTVRVRVVFQDGTFERHDVPLRFDSPVPVRALLEMADDDLFAERKLLVKRLQAKGAFGYAREALERYPAGNLSPAQREWVLQQRALCTYKDALLPLATRLQRALEILRGPEDRLAETTDPETLGLAGAILKRIWEVDGQRTHLEQSLQFYRRGFEEMVARGESRPDYDGGAFTGVNAAYVADLLAAEADGDTPIHAAMLAEARNVRDRLATAVKNLSRQNWWTLNSLAQTYLAQASTDPSKYETARESLESALAQKNVSDWELETTATQLRALVDTHARLWPSERARIVREGYDVVSLLFRGQRLRETAVRGKMGLALSGGGFRASLFHIGVLARLAERDLLRHVEVLSCVSGGSIVGAYYYLELKHLLERKRDADVKASDYIEIVRRMEHISSPACRTTSASAWRRASKPIGRCCSGPAATRARGASASSTRSACTAA
jgi:Tetratricopeptide Repeats-Sensor/prokaryotic YEATS domain/Patatin-like phospholipase